MRKIASVQAGDDGLFWQSFIICVKNKFRIIAILPLLFIAVETSASSDLTGMEISGEPRAQSQFLIYYANETLHDNLNSPNYEVFLTLLGEEKSTSANEIHDALIIDANESEQFVERDKVALIAAAKSYGVKLVIFTNRLTLSNTFQFFDPENERVETMDFDAIFATEDPLLEYAPLSMPENFKRAINTITTLSRINNEKEIAIILRSHGTYHQPLMPRVNLDFTQIRKDVLIKTLRGSHHDDLNMPEIKFRGTSQLEIWQIISEFSYMSNTRFPFIFLSSCESGPQNVAEAWSIPSSVSKVIHSGRRGISSQAIDYRTIMRPAGSDAIGFKSLIVSIRNVIATSGQSIRMETPISILLNELILWLKELSFVTVFGISLVFFGFSITLIRYGNIEKDSNDNNAIKG